MKQQWALMLEQLDIVKRDGHALVPVWRIEAHDGPWLILTRFDHDKPGQHERMLQLIRRFVAWKLAQSFILVGETWLGTAINRTDEEAVFVVGQPHGRSGV